MLKNDLPPDDAEAARRVAHCLEHGRDHLNLAGLRLTALPPGFVELTGLRYLDLTRNRLTALPDAVCKMTRLRWLGCNFNVLATLPENIGALTALERFYLRRNQLRTVPESFGSLARLVELDLYGNRIGRLPRSFARLLEPERPQALHFDFGDNQSTPVVSAALAGAKMLRSFLQDTQIETREGKLLLVGEGEMGKSTLLQALLGRDFTDLKGSPHGLTVEPLKLDAPGGREIRLHCWDFSGQATMRETHQVFFTAPAIYLLLWNQRLTSHAARLDEWLAMIRQRTHGRARVFIVGTNASKRTVLSEPETLSRKFGDIIAGFHEVECRPADGRSGIEELKALLAAEAGREGGDFSQTIAERWLAALGRIETARADGHAFVSMEEFARIAVPPGAPPASPAEAAELCTALAGMGRLAWHPHGALCDTVVLHPDWLSRAIGRVLGDEPDPAVPAAAAIGDGLVTRQRMHERWTLGTLKDENDRLLPPYDAKLFPIFHRLMEEYDLCHSMSRADLFLIPPRLEDKRPSTWETDWPLPERPRLSRRIALKDFEGQPLGEWLAGTFFFRLMARLGSDALGQHQLSHAAHWRKGFRLAHDFYGEARLERRGAFILFEASGSNPSCLWGRVEEACSVLAHDLRQRLAVNIAPEAEVPCKPDCQKDWDQRAYYSLTEITEYLHPADGGEPDENIRCKVCNLRIPVISLWDGSSGATGFQRKVLEKLGDIKEDTGRIRLSLDELYPWLAAQFSEQQTRLLTSWRDGLQHLTAEQRRMMEEFKGEQRAALHEMLKELKDRTHSGPALFSVVPRDPDFFKSKGSLFATSLTLRLHCEHSLWAVSFIDEDPQRGEFAIEVDKSWWQKAAPWVKGGLRILGAMQAPLVLLADKNVTDTVKNLADAAKLPDELFTQLDAPPKETLAEDAAAPLRAAGDTLAWLHNFLRTKTGTTSSFAELTPHHTTAHFGLVLVKDSASGRHLWVHPGYAEQYAPA